MSPIIETADGATPLDRDELEGLRHRHITLRAELDVLEQANIETGILWLARRRSRAILTDHFAPCTSACSATSGHGPGRCAERRRTSASIRE